MSIANNKLSGTVPTFIAAIGGIQYCYLEGNKLKGEVSSQLCDVIAVRNMTLSLTNNPDLTCYQELCWSKLPSTQRRMDPALRMCVPSVAPSIIPTGYTPTRTPTTKPSSIPTRSPTTKPSYTPTMFATKPAL